MADSSLSPTCGHLNAGGQDQKICPRCEVMLPLEAFNVNRARKDGRQTYCRSCDNAMRRAWYRRPGSSKRVIELIRKRKREGRKLVFEFKLERGCSRCPERHPAALDFHHRDSSQKVARISEMIAEGVGLGKIAAEIKKCDLVCANCHRKLHYEEKYGPVAQRESIRLSIGRS